MTLTTANARPMVKDPQAILDFGFSWSDWLTGAETISTSTWTITSTSGESPVLLTKDPPGKTSSHDATTTTVWLAAGTLGQSYTVTNHVVTSAGREDDRSIRVNVWNR